MSVGMCVTARPATLALSRNRGEASRESAAKLDMRDYDGDGDKIATGWRAWTLSTFYFSPKISVDLFPPPRLSSQYQHINIIWAESSFSLLQLAACVAAFPLPAKIMQNLNIAEKKKLSWKHLHLNQTSSNGSLMDL